MINEVRWENKRIMNIFLNDKKFLKNDLVHCENEIAAAEKSDSIREENSGTSSRTLCSCSPICHYSSAVP